jgi:anti-sigma factor RsiW
VDCILHQHLLDAYLDGELAFERTLEVEAHLASCTICSSEVQGWKDSRAALQGSNLYYRAPAHLEANLRKLIPQTRKQQTPWFQQSIWALGGAAFATSVLAISFVVMRPAARSPYQDMVASHIRSLMSNRLMDVVSTDQHTVKPWFDGKLDFAPPVQDFAADGYPLAGGRLDYVDDQKVAVLVYQRALHIINVYVWPAKEKETGEAGSQTIQGYNIVSWRQNGFEFCAVSDLNTAELRDLTRLFMP